jgi:hypothetical protein
LLSNNKQDEQKIVAKQQKMSKDYTYLILLSNNKHTSCSQQSLSNNKQDEQKKNCSKQSLSNNIFNNIHNMFLTFSNNNFNKQSITTINPQQTTSIAKSTNNIINKQPTTKQQTTSSTKPSLSNNTINQQTTTN